MRTRGLAQRQVLQLPHGVPLVKLRFRGKDGFVATARAPPPFPIEAFVQTCLDVCREFATVGGTPPPVPRSRANAMLNMVVVCKESRDLLMSDPQWLHLSAFLGALVHPERRVHFFDGIPPSISLFEGVHGTRNLAHQTARDYFRLGSGSGGLTKRRVLKDRYETAAALASAPVDALPEYRCYSVGAPAPPQPPLPSRLAAFLGRARVMAQGLATHRDASHFGACRACGRRAFVGSVLLSDDEEDEEEEERYVGELSTSARYWAASGGTYPTPASFLFCAQACASVYYREVELAMGIKAQELEYYDAPDSKSGVARVASALRAAFNRNQLVARRLRVVKATDFSLLSPDAVVELRAKSIAMLTIDTGMLIACATIAETAVGRMRALPPTFHGWRRLELVYVAPIFRVRELFDKYAESGSGALILHQADQSRFAAKCRSEARAVFA